MYRMYRLVSPCSRSTYILHVCVLYTAILLENYASPCVCSQVYRSRYISFLFLYIYMSLHITNIYIYILSLFFPKLFSCLFLNGHLFFSLPPIPILLNSCRRQKQVQCRRHLSFKQGLYAHTFEVI